jgi:DNA-directed RNA polymerase specialized sigma24 family protein
VRAAIDALPERLREVVALTEYAHGEIAAPFGISAGTVGSRRNGPIEDA